MSTHPVALFRRAATWLVLTVAIIATAFNVWLGVNGNWPGWVAAALLAILAGSCFRSLWRDPSKAKR